jgi:uncharacterized linocin/CFP29 family protein
VNHLNRSLAPVSEEAWKAVDAEAERSLRTFLAARRLVEFAGPRGWDHSADNLGTLERVDEPVEGVQAGVRSVQPLVELRTPFSVLRSQLDDIDRGRADADLSTVVEAARRAALAEDRIVFHGFKSGGILGMAEASPHPRLPISDDYTRYPSTVAQAVTVLKSAGVDGPYACALGPRCYTGVIETTEYGGYPVLEHIHLILGGPVVWAPAVEGAVVLSMRGGDFQLSSGQDFAIGFAAAGAGSVELYLEESIGFRALTPEAAVPLVYSS